MKTLKKKFGKSSMTSCKQTREKNNEAAPGVFRKVKEKHEKKRHGNNPSVPRS
jgi:hypothetical protein